MAKTVSTWPLFFFAGLLLIAFILRIVQTASSDSKNIPVPRVQIILDETTCSASGGAWNACGSMCRTSPGLPCAQVCVEQCGCTSGDQCPFGFSCEAFVDGQGVCGVTSSSSL